MTSETGQVMRQGIPWRVLAWSVPVVLLTVPLIARFPWTPSDYLFAATIFAVVGGALELAVRASPSLFYRAGAGVALLAAFLLVWINAAVGIIGGEDNPANLMYAGVLAVAALGTIVARARPRGMARAMAGAATAQATIAGAVLVGGLGATEPPGAWGILALNTVFVVLFAASAGLFALAARESTR